MKKALDEVSAQLLKHLIVVDKVFSYSKNPYDLSYSLVLEATWHELHKEITFSEKALVSSHYPMDIIWEEAEKADDELFGMILESATSEVFLTNPLQGE